MNGNPAIDASQLAKRYGRRWAVAGVSLQVAAGSVVMVAGRNGSGKSTLFRLLATAIRADGGSARVGGYDLVREREDVRRVTALMTHQSYLYEALTGRENLTIASQHIGRADETSTLLERVGLASRGDDPVSAYSAGMRKRLMLARLLLQKPRIAFLDEPYGQLDPEGFVMIDEIIRGLRSDGVTVLVATHQLPRVSGLADRAIVLEQGRIAHDGAPHEVPC